MQEAGYLLNALALLPVPTILNPNLLRVLCVSVVNPTFDEVISESSLRCRYPSQNGQAVCFSIHPLHQGHETETAQVLGGELVAVTGDAQHALCRVRADGDQ